LPDENEPKEQAPRVSRGDQVNYNSKGQQKKTSIDKKGMLV